MATRIGVDIGGTFTDLICYDDDSGNILVEKVPTTPASPETGCVEAVKKAVPPDLLNKSEYFLHGTTVGLNALLERRGAIVGLLATEGFRDVLEIRKGDRGDWYNLFWVPQAPLVPRRLRLPVRERIRSNGEVLTEMENDDVLKALDIFEREGVNAIAVCLLNAYANPAHELEVKRILEDKGFTERSPCPTRYQGNTGIMNAPRQPSSMPLCAAACPTTWNISKPTCRKSVLTGPA